MRKITLVLNIRKKIRKTVAAFLIIVILSFVFFSTSTSAVTFDCNVKTYSDSIFMVNLDTGIPILEKDADVKRAPASLVKIMTYIVAAEYFEDFDTRIEIKQEVIDEVLNNGMVCSGLDWHVGDKLTVTDILYALMVPVGHDAAMVLADYIKNEGKSNIVDLMNQKAEDLSCTSTHFTNPTGVDDSDQYTTAKDMYLITKYALGLPLFSKICSTSTYYLNDEKDEYPIVTTNYLIDVARGGDYFYSYATGIKNGTTEKAGRCLVATAVYEGYAYMCICLHAPYNEEKEQTDQYCMIEAADLFRWAFLNLSFVTAATKDTPICEQKVDHAWDTNSILLVPETDLSIVLPDDYSESDITITPDNTNSVSAPIEKGDIITTATVAYKGEDFMKINLIAQKSVKVSPILYTTDIIRSVLTSVWFLLCVGLVVILFIVYISVSSRYNKRKKADEKRRYK